MLWVAWGLEGWGLVASFGRWEWWGGGLLLGMKEVVLDQKDGR